MVRMKFVHSFIISGLLFVALSGCNPGTPEQQRENTASQAAETEKTDQQKDADKKAAYQKDLVRAKRLSDNGRVLKPITDVKFDVKKTDGSLSIEDALRSYEFRKGAIKRCYVDALIDEFEAKGSVSMTVKYADQGRAVVENYKSTITVPGFDDCIQKAAQIWRVPAGSSLDAEITFSSRPAPNLGELREINKQVYGHYEHEHGHEGEEANAPEHAAEGPVE